MNKMDFYYHEMNVYHPERSQISPDTLASWLRYPINGDLYEVPGILEPTVRLLNKHGIETTWQLIGKFLSYKSEKITSQEHIDLFWNFLKYEVGITSHVAGIVRCIAEKADTMMPGLYDPSVYI